MTVEKIGHGTKQFSKGEIQMAEKQLIMFRIHSPQGSTIKTTLRVHLTPVRCVRLKKQRERLKMLPLMAELQAGMNHYGNQCEVFSKKLEIDLSYHMVTYTTLVHTVKGLHPTADIHAHPCSLLHWFQYLGNGNNLDIHQLVNG